MSDREKIESAIIEMASANGSIAVQTLTYLMQTFLQEQGDNDTVQEAIQHLNTIADTAHSIADEPDEWIFNGRFSETLFNEYFLRTQDAIAENLKRVLRKLDATFQQQFSVESAQSYLRDVARCSSMLQKDLES